MFKTILLFALVLLCQNAKVLATATDAASAFLDQESIFQNMGAGMKQKMSFMAVATSQIQDPKVKAAMLKEFQTIFTQKNKKVPKK